MDLDYYEFSAETPLVEVLRNPGGNEVMNRLAPSIAESTLLHTFHGQPIGLVLATEEGISKCAGDQIIAELKGIGPRAAPRGGDQRFMSPTKGYQDESVAVGSAGLEYPTSVEIWRRLELRIEGPDKGNPYVDVEVTARFFAPDGSSYEVLGFYDGDTRYRVRFLAAISGGWRFEVSSNARSIDGLVGAFVVFEGNGRGPVKVADRFHFAYANGDRYLPVGTTIYAWTHQEETLQDATVQTLAGAPFNKVRMCVFPKSYTFNSNEPARYPFQRTAEGWDPDRFDPAYWANLEYRMDQLDELGIEVDLILFHPYDRWGFSSMDAATDDRYVRYVVARLSAFRNTWWSLANEFDLLFGKTEADWERWASIILRWDASDHLRSIHNCRIIYDQTRPWITHVSIQRLDAYRTAENTSEWRARWGKPIIIDECAYEGDIDQGWGNISGQELVRRFWEGALRGGYVGHGETYVDADEVLWWAKGGELHGTSPERIRFLAELTESSPGGVLEPLDLEWDAVAAGVPGEYYLYYFGFGRPSFRRFFHDPSIAWYVDVIDTWHMTSETLPQTMFGRFVVPLPGREYMAIRLRRVI